MLAQQLYWIIFIILRNVGKRFPACDHLCFRISLEKAEVNSSLSWHSPLDQQGINQIVTCRGKFAHWLFFFFRYCVWQGHTRKKQNKTKQHCSSQGIASAFFLAEGKGYQLHRNVHEFEDSRPPGKPKRFFESPVASRYVPCAVMPHGSTVAVQQPPRSRLKPHLLPGWLYRRAWQSKMEGLLLPLLTAFLPPLLFGFVFFIAQTLKTDDHKTVVCHFQN